MAEVRPIDANALKRDLIDNWAFYSVLMKNALDRQPTIDAVPVVRCKDCKHWKRFRDDRGLCKQETFTLDDNTVDPVTEPNDFCSYGERREDDG